jgi:hypothetical protein
MPVSTFRGRTVPFRCANRSLRLPLGGAIRSGGVEAEPGGATDGTGFDGAAGCGFCAMADPAAAMQPISTKILGIA